MTELTFESRCLESTLRTLRLRPTDILLDASRVPAHENDPLLQVARPTWIGRNYRTGGILLLGKNPAGGTVTHQQTPHPSDEGLANALFQLIETAGMDAYRAWRDVGQPQAMRTWRIWQISVRAVLDELTPFGIGEDDIAFGNLVPFRTAGNTVEHDEFVRSWNQDVRKVVGLLQPCLIVKMTAKFRSFRSHCSPDIKILQFRRHVNDGTVTSYGRIDLAGIREWMKTSYKGRT